MKEITKEMLESLNINEETLAQVSGGAVYDSSKVYFCTKCKSAIPKDEIDFSSDTPRHINCGSEVTSCSKSLLYGVARSII